MSEPAKGNYGKYTLTLAVIAGCAAVLVGGVFAITAESIRRNDAKVKEDALALLFPEADAFEPVGSEDAGVLAAHAGAEILGYAATGKAPGYGGDILVLVGVKPNLQNVTLVGIKVLPGHNETPGLGAKVDEVAADDTLWTAIGGLFSGKEAADEDKVVLPWFQEQFFGRTGGEVKAFAGNPKGYAQSADGVTSASPAIDAITAATISSRAVANAVLDGIARIKGAGAE